MKLDLDCLELTDAEGQRLLLALLVGHGKKGVKNAEGKRQFEALESWVMQVKRDVTCINLILSGHVTPSVDGDGTIAFKATPAAAEQFAASR